MLCYMVEGFSIYIKFMVVIFLYCYYFDCTYVQVFYNVICSLPYMKCESHLLYLLYFNIIIEMLGLGIFSNILYVSYHSFIVSVDILDSI